MNRKVLPFVLILCMFLAALAGCKAKAAEEVFTTPDVGKPIDGTTVYEGTDFFEGMSFGMSYDEYISIVSERYGKDANVTYDAKAMEIDEGCEWKHVHTKLYDPSREINSYVTAIFLNGKLDQLRAGSLVYATSVENFKERVEILISEHEDIYGDLKGNSLDVPAGSYQSFNKWQHRFWETYYGLGTEGYLEEGFFVDIALPDALVNTESGREYIVAPYEEGEAGVILYTYATRRSTRGTPDDSAFSDEMLWFEKNPGSYIQCNNYYPADHVFDF